jgi:hypothetical protein
VTAPERERWQEALRTFVEAATPEERASLKAEVLQAAECELWAQGEAHELHLDAGQSRWVREFDASTDFAVWMIARQRGKSFADLYGDTMFAQRTEGAICRYLGQTKESAQAIAGPTLDQIFRLCPDKSLLPWPYSKNGALGDNYELHWEHNGASLTISGTDNESFRRQRGPRSHRISFDEAAFYAKLVDVEGALLPSLQTTGGKPLYLSTPPISPGHEFVARYRAAQAAGTAKHETIYDNPRLTKEGVRAIAQREAARLLMTLEELLESTYWKREYLAQIVTETSRAAVPSWNEDAAKVCVASVPRPAHFDGYVGLDFGFGDPHAAVFGYWDFPSQTLVIEHELLLRQANTAQLAEALKAKEREAWGATLWEGTLLGAEDWRKDMSWEQWPDFLKGVYSAKAPRQPYLRVGDNDPLVLADLIAPPVGLAVLPSRKDDKALQVNALDILVKARKIRIDPRCVQLIRQLYSTVWNKQRTEWERTTDGHGDLLDALVYLVRNVRRHRDPRPPEKPTGWEGFTNIGGAPKFGNLAAALKGARRR